MVMSSRFSFVVALRVLLACQRGPEIDQRLGESRRVEAVEAVLAGQEDVQAVHRHADVHPLLEGLIIRVSAQLQELGRSSGG